MFALERNSCRVGLIRAGGAGVGTWIGGGTGSGVVSTGAGGSCVGPDGGGSRHGPGSGAAAAGLAAFRGPGVDPRRKASSARRRWVRALPAHDVLGHFVEGLAGPAWWVINRPAVRQTPLRALEMLVDRAVETFIVCGDQEAWMIRRGATARRRFSSERN
jgi:hypothetical protein